eukprot:2301588-Pyramimonas_sp.AAC.1
MLVQKPQCFLWPHEIFSALYDKYPEMFASSVCSDRASIQGFWEDMDRSGHPGLHNHPMRGVPGWD